MTNSRACLQNTESLVEFQKNLAFFSGSVERALDFVSNYINDVRAEMERHIALLKNAVKQAKEGVEAARAEKDAAEAGLQQASAEREGAYAELQKAIRLMEELEEMYESGEYDEDIDLDF